MATLESMLERINARMAADAAKQDALIKQVQHAGAIKSAGSYEQVMTAAVQGSTFQTAESGNVWAAFTGLSVTVDGREYGVTIHFKDVAATEKNKARLARERKAAKKSA